MSVTGVSMHAISPARLAAFRILREVSAGGYASDLLRVASAQLSPKDAGLAAQLVFGCLRFQAQLDYLIGFYSKKASEKLDLEVRIALRIGIFQLRFLERIPPHAAVHDSVELVKRSKRSAVGFVNAVLRKVNRQPVNWPDPATALSCPAWLLDRWSGQFGEQAAISIAKAALEEPEAYIRIAPGHSPPPDVSLEPAAVPGAYRVLSHPPAGARLHDIGSQTVVPLLDLRAGCSYLDLCAAPGNKTLQALESRPSLAVACDVSWNRLSQIPPACPRVVLDASQELPFKRTFDRVFVDAPCSGTGTLARNPEIKWRLRPDDLARFHEIQMRILLQAAKALAPGGKLLYATCSLEKEENEDVVAEVLAQQPGLHIQAEQRRLPGHDAGDGFYTAVMVAGTTPAEPSKVA